MRIANVFRYIAFKPMDAVGFILALSVLLAGLYLLSPFLTIAASTSAQITNHTILALPRFLGLYQVIAGSAWIVAIFNKHKKWSIPIRRTAAMSIFLLYTFYGISGIFLYGMERVTWLGTFTIALIAAVKYLYLGLVGDRDDGN
jgi:hypothetical protein